MFRVGPLGEVAPAAVEQLLDLAFGPDRHGRTAYRLRAGVGWLPHLSFAGFDGGAFVASLQCWPMTLYDDRGGETALTLVGPIAVAPERQGEGFGRLITHAAVDAADATGAPPLALIGDPEFYCRFFGFAVDPTAGWRLPGPCERRRLLARVPAGTTLPASGLLGPPGRSLAEAAAIA